MLRIEEEGRKGDLTEEEEEERKESTYVHCTLYGMYMWVDGSPAGDGWGGGGVEAWRR